MSERLRRKVWAALETVLDPELDEPITDLDFVESCTVSAEGVVSVGLRLPTFFCAPNFSFLMVADAYDAVSAAEGVTRADMTLADHCRFLLADLGPRPKRRPASGLAARP